MMMVLAFSSALAGPPIHDGDVVFHRSGSSQAQLLERVTGSPIGHVGVVVHVDGRPMVLEAISPVSLTPLAQWADRAADGRIAIKRLRDADSALTPEARQRMIALGRSWLGRPYDSRFGWSDDQLYCSELVHKLFVEAGVELGTPHPLRDFDLSDPEVAAAARARFGGALPLDELVVAPVDLYDDPDLVEVCVGPVDVCAR